MIETWKHIDGYEKYQISNTGIVKSLDYHRQGIEKILYQRIPENKYPYVVLCKNGKTKTFKVHRLVALMFIENPENKIYVNHKDGDKTNNRVENLEWVSALENNLHCYRVLHKHPKIGFIFDKDKRSKEVEQYLISEKGHEYRLATYSNARAASMITKISERSINSCCNGKYGQAGGYKWKFKN